LGETLTIGLYGIFTELRNHGGNSLPQAGALWHYKKCWFDTSYASRAGRREDTMTMMTAIGLMSGTSLDGVDVALIETDGKRVKAFGPSGYRPYTETERGLLRQALTEAINLPQRDARPGILRDAERAVTIAHAEAVAAFTAQNRIAREDVDIVGFHGQTVLHRPAQKMTVQIGDAAALAKAIHIPVMHDFRAADVAAGGQGAPFVPVYHRALAQSLERQGPIVVVNIGGVSNITYIDGSDILIACDTGPGNALLDDFMFRVTGQPFDLEGRMAAQGAADEAWVARALEHPFFALPPPKSLDRNDFASLTLREMPPADGAATLTAFTATAIARIVALLPKVPRSWIVAGGGARNLTMLRLLRERLAPATVEAADTLGWSADAIEAQAFGFLAARGLKGLPLSYPATTGVPIPMTGGVIARP
jgi:anhydro-N-acetylmuramic acid kinase